jgi:CheY-like chemotaxis protein
MDPAPRPHVLVIDDDPVVREVAVRRLRVRGHQVTAVGDGLAALAEAAGRRLEIVIVDLEMPGMGGLEVIRRLREEQPLARVVVMTSHVALDTVLACLKEGAMTFVGKPLGDCADLDAAVDHAAWVINHWKTQLARVARMRKA